MLTINSFLPQEVDLFECKDRGIYLLTKCPPHWASYASSNIVIARSNSMAKGNFVILHTDGAYDSKVGDHWCLTSLGYKGIQVTVDEMNVKISYAK